MLARTGIVAAAWLALQAGASAAARRPDMVRHRSFYVGGDYAGPTSARVMHDQMFVEEMIPAVVAHRYPLVLIHGHGQTATNWLTTPDGREGWADFFVARGWRVFVVDQPARGRSAWQPGVDPALTSFSVSTVEKLFTAPEDAKLWPQAVLHTQWPGGPGKGHAGDPMFDQFFASQVPSIPSDDSERLMRVAGAALLDRIGPAVLLVHSQAGLFGWSIADARPGLVKGIVAVEPAGPPYQNAVVSAAYDRPWGLTSTPLTYDPPVTASSPLTFEQQATAEGPGLARCWRQAGLPRRLPRLLGVPIMILTSEASYHAGLDHCTSEYLTQAGVANDAVRLADRGIHGNGHMMMLEKNNLQIAALIDCWLGAHVRPTGTASRRRPVRPTYVDSTNRD